MPTTQLTVKHRPLRIGFLVAQGDVNALVRIAGINSLLWGGIRNAVLPVGLDSTFTEQLMKLFNVDVLFPATDTPETKALIEKHPFLATPSHLAERIFFEDWHTKKQDLAVLDVMNLIEHYWRTEFRHRPPGFESAFSIVEWDEQDSCAQVFALSFGRFVKTLNLKEDFRDAFEKGLRARTVKVDQPGNVDSSLATAAGPLLLTEQRLEEYGGSHHEAGIYFGMAGDFADLLNFWNLRAAGITLEYVALDHVDRFKDFIQAHVTRLDSFPSRYPNDVGFIGVYCADAVRQKAAEIAKQFQVRKRLLITTCSRHLWNGLNVVPSQCYFSRDGVLANVDSKRGKYTVSFALPAKPLSDEDSRRDTGMQHLVAVVDPLVEFEFPNHTLKPPYLRELNEFLSRRIVFDPWKLRVDPDGIALIERVYESAESLYPVPFRDVVVKLFDLACVTAQMSPPGLIAERIIDSMRETDPLEACRVFKVRGARKLLKELRPGKAIAWKDAVATIGREQFGKFKGLYIEARDTPELTPADVLTFLLEKRILCPQLRTWERLLGRKQDFRCRICGLKSKVPLRVFEGRWSCPFCNQPQELMPLVGTEFRSPRSMWRFKRCGFFAKDNNQEGALPVILTLLQLKRILHDSTFVYSTALSLKARDGKKCETDLAVLHYGRRGSIELGIGECKDERGTITDEDIGNLRMVAELFRDHGISTFLIFAKTSDSFLPEELDRFRQLKEEGVAPVLLTNRELDPYDPYESYREATVPVRYAFSLDEMAKNSEAIYLAGA